MTRAILFDLDGTLVDSAPAICAGLRAALTAVGAVVPADDRLRACIGLPLPHVWTRLGLAPEQHVPAVAGYRAWAAEADLRPAEPFPGMPALLAELHAGGHQLVLASAKDTASARRAIGERGWSGLFAAVSGCEPGDGPDKRALVARALAMLPAPLRAGAVMVGDMTVDADAAAANGIAFIAVAWGYGERAALQAMRPSAVVDDAEALRRLLA